MLLSLWLRGTRPWVQSRSGFKTSQCSRLPFFMQSTCKVPDSRDVTPVLRDIGISALAATLAAIWRLSRSFFPSLRKRRDSDQGKNWQPLLLEVPPEERGGSLPGRFPGSVLHIWVLFRTPNANTCSISGKGHNSRHLGQLPCAEDAKL